MQTESSFLTFLMPRNWDIKVPGTLLISKPWDKCRRNSQTTKRTSEELLKGQMHLPKEYGFDSDKHPWPQPPTGRAGRGHSGAWFPVPLASIPSACDTVMAHAEHVALLHRTGIRRLWSGAAQNASRAITWENAILKKI